MSGMNDCIVVAIPHQGIETDKPKADEGISVVSSSAWVWSVWDFCREDPYRVIFPLKVGLAVLLVSLLALFRPPYMIFETSVIWSILTVVIMFEYTIGATFSRGFNRALGSLLAGILAIIVAEIAFCSGQVAEPFIIGAGIFITGAATTFLKQRPSFVQYEYGLRVILLTFCLLVVSGYRIGTPIRTSVDRLYSIGIGGLVTVLVNVLIFPIWAGELLHKELVKSFNSVADSLEECVNKYLEEVGLDHPESSKTVMEEFPEEPAYRRCRAILNSSGKLESLAQAAKWEPPHGRFRQLFYPWSEYVKVGAILRYCAYQVMALHSVLHSEIQAPYNLRMMFRAEIRDAANQSAELVRTLGKDISNMKRGLKTSLLKRAHGSAEQLQSAIYMHSYLLTLEPKLNWSLSIKQDAPPTEVTEKSPESYHETTRKQSMPLHSWPSRKIDISEENVFKDKTEFVPRLNTYERTASLSLTTFASLLIEFVARMDHLVVAVDGLSKMANFKSEVLSC